MKKFGKIMTIVAAVAMCLSIALGLVACGETKATVTDVYTARGKLTAPGDDGPKVQNAYSTTVELYSDGTYVLTDVYLGYMSAYSYSQVGSFTTVMFGTYTQEAGSEKDTLTLKLAKATRVIYNQVVTAQDPINVDTDNAESFEGVEDLTAADLLSKCKEFTLVVNSATKTITSGVTAGSNFSLA